MLTCIYKPTGLRRSPAIVHRLLVVILTVTALSFGTAGCQSPALFWQPTPTFTIASTLPPTATLNPTPTATPTATPSSTPAPTSSPTPDASPTPRPTASAEQLQVFEQVWSTVKDNYLYPDFNGVNWEDIHQEFLPSVQAGLTIQDFYAAMSEMIKRLNDEHSVFLNPQQVAEQQARYSGDFHYVGVGVVTMSIPERRRLTIGAVFPGSPAEEAGLRMHDNILQIDGMPIIDEKEDRRSLLRGPEGSQVTLTVQYPGEQPRQVTITRRAVQGTMPTPHQVLTTPGGKRIGYILLLTFEDENIPNGVRQALKELSQEGPLDGLILDVRLNPGGASTIFEKTISFFVQGAVGSIVNRQKKIPIRVQGEDIQGSQGVPLVVLTGQRTSSFGEIFAGAVQDLGRATIVGEITDGNVELLEVYPLQDGSRLWLAHHTYRPVNHPQLDWEKRGIIPDIKVSSNWDEVTLETDPIVQAALAHFDQS